MANQNLPEKLPTGISGLDDILGGGLPSGHMYLLEGDPGTGKTTVAMQFVLAGQKAGGRPLYITLSEPRAELVASAASHGWDFSIPIVEFVPDELSLDAEQQYTVFHPSEVELASTIQRLIAEIEKVRPDRLVIDSLSELRLLSDSGMRYRRQLLALKQYFSGLKTTVLLLDDRTGDGHDLQLQSIAHGVIRLEKMPRSFGNTRRHIEILKLRGTSYREGYHDYLIRYGGVVVFPRLIASEHPADYPRAAALSQLPFLDSLFGGGIEWGSSVLLSGPTGAGKSSIAMQYAYAAAQRGEQVYLFTFDESLRTLIARAEGMGQHLQPLVDSGLLHLEKIDPAELSPGQFSWRVRDAVASHNARMIIIDGLNGLLTSMPGEQDLILHLHELLVYLNQQGAITLITLALQGLVGSMQTPLDVSYLADTVVLLRYFEVRGEIRQAISILKKRIGEHERTIREFSFRKNGIYLGKPLTNFRGVLTGVPELLGPEPSDAGDLLHERES
jgi:circadian clock protein KaiC